MFSRKKRKLGTPGIRYFVSVSWGTKKEEKVGLAEKSSPIESSGGLARTVKCEREKKLFHTPDQHQSIFLIPGMATNTC